MTSLLLLFALLMPAASGLDDLVIERRANRVEWDDLFMEYSRYHAPSSFQTINVTFDFVNFRQPVYNTFSCILELTQVWNDDRLRFNGVSSVPVPSTVHPWTPDSYIRNALRDEVAQKSLSLNFDGTFALKQRHSTKVACDWDLRDLNLDKLDIMNCSLVFSSFDNFGTTQIVYNVVETIIENKTFLEKYEVKVTKRTLKSGSFSDVNVSFLLHRAPKDIAEDAAQKALLTRMNGNDTLGSAEKRRGAEQPAAVYECLRQKQKTAGVGKKRLARLDSPGERTAGLRLFSTSPSKNLNRRFASGKKFVLLLLLLFVAIQCRRESRSFSVIDEEINETKEIAMSA
ncbi:unnamed protein product [Caenorhabditis auriculariae]|uniref:Neurotransmitter-gated ion-channel ligand-binding domain-containing protein n=1 Tax=Caenorhabditis auriculariae TaxID=2777116 RepID=A0A8S1HPS0_9PELO|nr:unnamed protein product [Caenorhabditis auriculariae]